MSGVESVVELKPEVGVAVWVWEGLEVEAVDRVWEKLLE